MLAGLHSPCSCGQAPACDEPQKIQQPLQLLLHCCCCLEEHCSVLLLVPVQQLLQGRGQRMDQVGHSFLAVGLGGRASCNAADAVRCRYGQVPLDLQASSPHVGS